MRIQFTRRFWMSVLLGMMMLMLPLALVLISIVAQQDPATKRVWLPWVFVYFGVFFAFFVGLILLTLQEIREVFKQYHLSRRDAFRDTVEQIREDYHRRQRLSQGNGNPGKRP